MQLHIKNIGPIGSAEIDLTGLTVIGGLNDSGKSTIGKSLFAIVKAIRNIEDEFAAGQRNKILPITTELISRLRKQAGPSISPSVFNNILRRVRDVRRFSGDGGLELFDELSEGIKTEILDELERRIPHAFVERAGKRQLVPVGLDSMRTKAREILDEFFPRIKAIATEKQEPKEVYLSSFKNMFNAIFKNEINNKTLPNNEGFAKLFDNGNEILSASFRKNSLSEKKLKIEDNIASSLFEDATLLESPFVLNFIDDLIMMPRSSSGEYSGTYATYDLLEKLNFASKEAEPSSALEKSITESISQTINGMMYFESDSDDFVFASNEGFSVKVGNTASGVKTLGILQMLARSGVLNTSNLLIIDEPEVHLHPAWQIVYAEIVAILVKNNVYCVVSSHSPYFIQALEAYSKIYSVDKLTRFYISLKTGGLCDFKDVTSNPEPLYKLLADPMKRIAYLRAKAQNQNE